VRRWTRPPRPRRYRKKLSTRRFARCRWCELQCVLQTASAVQLLLFDRADDARPSRVIDLDPRTTTHVPLLACLRAGYRGGQLYGYAHTAPSHPKRACVLTATRFCWILCEVRSETVPHVAESLRARRATTRDGTESVVADPTPTIGRTPSSRPHHETVIYECTASALTRHPNLGVEASRRGTLRESSTRSLSEGSCVSALNSTGVRLR